MSPKRRSRTPSYCLHKPSGQAVATLNGRVCYLGRYGSKASHEEYDRLIAEWLASGRCLPNAVPEHQLTVLELTAAFWKHVQSYYVKDGRLTSPRISERGWVVDRWRAGWAGVATDSSGV